MRNSKEARKCARCFWDFLLFCAEHFLVHNHFVWPFSQVDCFGYRISLISTSIYSFYVKLGHQCVIHNMNNFSMALQEGLTGQILQINIWLHSVGEPTRLDLAAELHLDPACRYSISVKADFTGAFRRMFMLYGGQVRILFVVDSILSGEELQSSG